MTSRVTGRANRTVLPEATWLALEADHHTQVDAWTTPHLARASTGQKHPVMDFLFTYYSHRPAQLRRWHPGAGTVLGGAAAQERLSWPYYTRYPKDVGPQRNPGADGGSPSAGAEAGVVVDVAAFLAARGKTLDFVRSLLVATSARPPQLGCFGLHEWAMVYRLAEGQQRHQDWPLRLGRSGTDAVLESMPVRCSHFDAFRFFTEPAQPLNTLQPNRTGQVDQEQPGCLHATMDLYKWAYQLAPAVPSALIVQCFDLARQVRLLDMRASPYDLSALGVTPVRIETPQGRAEYVHQQRTFTERGQQLRTDLLAAITAIAPKDGTGM